MKSYPAIMAEAKEDGSKVQGTSETGAPEIGLISIGKPFRRTGWKGVWAWKRPVRGGIVCQGM